MTKLVIAAAALALSTGSAVAQHTGFDWSGAYVGAQAGYVWGDATAVYPKDAGATSIDPNGLLGGAYIGYNHQMPNSIVLGIDADIAQADVSRTGHYVRSGITYNSTDSLKLHWSGAVRGRAGYAAGRFLPYLAAGVAFGRVNASSDDINPNFVGSWDKTYIGYTVGGGVEFAAASNIVLRSEYRYSDFGKYTFRKAASITEHTVNLKTHEIRIGIAYKF